jgi:hypothetical protein
MKKIFIFLISFIFLSFIIHNLLAFDEDEENDFIDSELGSETPFNSSWGNHDTFISPYDSDAYGPGINSDATGRPFRWETQDGQTLPPGSEVEPDGYGLGVGKDQFGRPVKPEPAW